MVFGRIARICRLGKWRHFKGYDLQGNRFFEFPHPLNPAATKRTIEYREKKEWSEYGFDSIPVQWNAWMRGTRQEPPTLQELQNDILRRQRLQANVAQLIAAYQEEKAQLQLEAERVAQLDAPRRKQGAQQIEQEQLQAPYPSHTNPSIVPNITAVSGHPPSQEFGANIPKSTLKTNVFPGMTKDSPERHHMATALDEAADMKLGKKKKFAQVKSGRAEQVKQGKATEQLPDAPATLEDKFELEAWKPKARRR